MSSGGSVMVSVKDQVLPELLKLKHLVSDRAPVFRAIGEALVSFTKRAFREPELRPQAWPNKKTGGPATLYKQGALARSARVVTANGMLVTIGSDRRYAAIHQFGGTTAAHEIRAKHKRALYWAGAAHPVRVVQHPGSVIPERPFFPINAQGQMTAKAAQTVLSIIKQHIAKAAKSS